MSRPGIRCALYTRKSSEEGLEQGFNSLDAQREACAAYVKSQAHEGWRALPDRYDDGGVSGGTMERPALRRLLEDIARGRVDVIVVYKIDRLTRSLPDFARIVEILDRHAVSFVSVTQAFNTTTSMGRLTLNVLLSFAQFEREVTGERIRDKIAASKAKGMWMGGTLPLGYDLPTGASRTLVVNREEADVVGTIFRTYLDLGSVNALERWLDARAIRSKRRVHRDGTVSGGARFSRGALFHLLRNPVYLGVIRHKGALHEGLHAAILDRDLFDAVQAHLAAQTRRRRASSASGGSRAALCGRIFDATGERMSPTFAIGARGRRYRYYVSVSLQQGRRAPKDRIVRRVPAGFVEQAVTERMRRVGGADPAAPLDALIRVEIHRGRMMLVLPDRLRRAAEASLAADEELRERPAAPDRICLSSPLELPRRGGSCGIAHAALPGPSPDPVLIRALRTAHGMLRKDAAGRATLDLAPASPHRRRLVRLAFLAPAIQAAILSGRQPRDMTLARLLATEIPPCWDAQTRRFGPIAG